MTFLGSTSSPRTPSTRFVPAPSPRVHGRIEVSMIRSTLGLMDKVAQSSRGAGSGLLVSLPALELEEERGGVGVIARA
eukprot:638193-Rhodomonas_salina.5